jgi:hypothetical protein
MSGDAQIATVTPAIVRIWPWNKYAFKRYHEMIQIQ